MSDPTDPTTALRAEIDRLREAKRQGDAALTTTQQERDAARASLATAQTDLAAAKQSATAWEAQGRQAAKLQTDLTAAQAEVVGITATSAAQLDMVKAGVHDDTVRDYLLHTYGSEVKAGGTTPPAWAAWWGAQRQQPSALLAPFLVPAAPGAPPPVASPPSTPPAPGAPPPPPAAPGAPPRASTGPSHTTLLNVPGAPPGAPRPGAPLAPAFPANAAAAPGPDGSGVYRPGSIVAAVTADPAGFAEQIQYKPRHPERFARPPG